MREIIWSKISITNMTIKTDKIKMRMKIKNLAISRIRMSLNLNRRSLPSSPSLNSYLTTLFFLGPDYHIELNT